MHSQNRTHSYVGDSLYRGPRKRKKGHEKIFEEIITENFPNMGKEIVTQVQDVQSPRQDKPKEEHAETR